MFYFVTKRGLELTLKRSKDPVEALMLEVAKVPALPDAFAGFKFPKTREPTEVAYAAVVLGHLRYGPESGLDSYDLEFRLSTLVRLVQERRRVLEQDRVRTGLVLTFIFICAVLLLLASVAYIGMQAIQLSMLDGVLLRLSPRLIEQAPHLWILSGAVPTLIIVLTVALSALTLTRIRHSTRTRVQEEVLRTYLQLVVQNRWLQQEGRRYR